MITIEAASFKIKYRFALMSLISSSVMKATENH